MFGKQNFTIKEKTGIINFLIRKRWARDEKQARSILLGVAFLSFAISAYFFSNAFKGPAVSKINPRTVPALPDSNSR